MSTAVAAARPAVTRTAGSRLRPYLPLLLAAVILLVVTAAFGILHRGISRDEAVYLTKADPSTPNVSWAPWRALGTPWLMAPIDVAGPHILAVRVYTSVLAAVALVLGFAPWLRLLRPVTVGLAAAFFATTWFVVYFGTGVYPNLWVALAAVAAVGLFARGLRDGGAAPRRVWVGVVVALIVAALMRPTDSAWVALPMGVVGLWQLRHRRLAPILAVVVGEVLGWIPWMVESYLSFDGPVKRFHQAGAGLGGVHPNLTQPTMYLRLLDGPFYVYQSHPQGLGGYQAQWLLWFAVVVLLVVVGLVLRGPAAPGLRLAAVTAVSTAAFYVVALDYGSTRFLLPAAALVALPAAHGLIAAADRVTRHHAVATGVVAVVALGLHAGLQVPTGRHLVQTGAAVSKRHALTVRDLRALSLRRPCLILDNEDGSPLSWALRCRLDTMSRAAVARAQRAARSGTDVVVVTSHKRLPAALTGWHPAALRGVHGWRAWFPPGRPAARPAPTNG